MAGSHVRKSAELARLIRPLAGRPLVGVVSAADCVELVFEAAPGKANLLSIFETGQIALGSVCEEWVAAGYGQAELRKDRRR